MKCYYAKSYLISRRCSVNYLGIYFNADGFWSYSNMSFSFNNSYQVSLSWAFER